MRAIHIKKFILIPLFLCLVFQPFCSKKKSSDKKSVSTGNIVVTVLDGDTFVLDSGEKVRIALVDTPESGELYYEEATQHLKDMVLNREISIKPVGSGKDNHGRVLAEVYLDSINIGQSLLSSGLAVLYLFSDNAYLKNKYLPCQVKAIENNYGIWSLPEPVLEDYYINIKGSYRFHRPLCSSLKRSDPEKFQTIDNRMEAFILGLSACRNCRP